MLTAPTDSAASHLTVSGLKGGTVRSEQIRTLPLPYAVQVRDATVPPACLYEGLSLVIFLFMSEDEWKIS